MLKETEDSGSIECPICGGWTSLPGTPEVCGSFHEALLKPGGPCWGLEDVVKHYRDEAKRKRAESEIRRNEEQQEQARQHAARMRAKRELPPYAPNPADPLRTRPDPGAQAIPAPTRLETRAAPPAARANRKKSPGKKIIGKNPLGVFSISFGEIRAWGRANFSRRGPRDVAGPPVVLFLSSYADDDRTTRGCGRVGSPGEETL